MAKPFKLLRDQISQARQANIKEKADQLRKEMPLQELRQARHLSQEHLANLLRVKQASISKLERRTDMYISTLRSFIQAMGGELEIVARFPDGTVRITQFEDLGQDDHQEREPAEDKETDQSHS